MNGMICTFMHTSNANGRTAQIQDEINHQRQFAPMHSTSPDADTVQSGYGEQADYGRNNQQMGEHERPVASGPEMTPVPQIPGSPRTFNRQSRILS